jgi:iron only hydrogenase large subunit-like protein
VLITLQSHTEVINFLKENGTSSKPRIPVISIAPQSLASLATAISSSQSAKVTPLQVLRRLRPFLKYTVGFSHVFDTTFARQLALKEHLTEYLERKAHDGSASSILNMDPGVEGRGQLGTGNGTSWSQQNGGECQLPMLASACPGWICYAEKTHSEILPFIARTKSPQQVMGTLVKEWMSRKWGRT